MKDWDKLLKEGERERERVKKREKGKKHPRELAKKEKASADVDFEDFSVKGKVSGEQEEELRDVAEDKLTDRGTTVERGACQPTDDGDLTCKFKKEGTINVDMPWAGPAEKPTIPVDIDATIDLKDFDEVRSHMMNEVEENKDVTVII